jgi:transcription factor AP-4
MQSINAGFESLKTLLPQQDGEKLSKAAILQQTSEYITSLEEEKSRLLVENAQLKTMLSRYTEMTNTDTDSQDSSPPKRKKRDTESSDEGIGMSVGNLEEVDEQASRLDDLRREMLELRRREQSRMVLDEQARSMEAQLYPERLRVLTTQLQAQMKSQQEKQKYLEGLQNHRHSKVPEIRDSESRTLTASSMSRRNLETIVEAIRHLEGDHVLIDMKPEHKDIPHSDDSEKESYLSSDREDCKSEASGRDSPILSVCRDSELAAVPITTATIHVSSEKYPIATQLLHHSPTIPTSLPAAYLQQRPGVIVTNLS